MVISSLIILQQLDQLLLLQHDVRALRHRVDHRVVELDAVVPLRDAGHRVLAQLLHQRLALNLCHSLVLLDKLLLPQLILLQLLIAVLYSFKALQTG